MNDALIARLGLDKEAFEAGLRNAVKAAATAQAKMATDAAKITNAAAAKSEESALKLAGAGKIKKNISGVTKDILAGGDATDIFANGLMHLANVFKVGLGTAAGFAVGAVIVKEVMEIDAAAKELKATIEKLGQPTGSADFSTLDGLHSRLEKIQEAGTKLKAEMDQNWFKQLGHIAAGITGKNLKEHAVDIALNPAGAWKDLAAEGGKNVAARREKEQQQITNAQNETLAQVAQKQRTITDIEEKRVHQSERIAAMAKLDMEFAEKRGALIAATAGMGVDTSEQVAELNRAQALEKEGIIAKLDAADRQAGLEETILGIRREGADVEERIAEARVLAADAELAAAKGDDAKRKASEQYEAAHQALDAAQRTTAEHKAQLALQSAVADMIGTEDAKHEAMLKGEREALQKRIADPKTKPDDRLQAGADLSKNLEQSRAFHFQQSMKGFAMADGAIDADTGDGQAEHMNALGEKAKVASNKAEFLRGNPLADPEQIAQAEAALAHIQRQYESIVMERRQSVEDAQSEVNIMREQLAGHDTLASRLKLESEYSDKIARAMKDGNDALTAQLQTQRAIALAQQAKDNAKNNRGDKFFFNPEKTPAEQNADRLDWLKRKRAQTAEDRKNKRDSLHSSQFKKGGPQPDVGNQGVTPPGEASGLDGEKHMPDRSFTGGGTIGEMLGHMDDRTFKHKGVDMGQGQYGPINPNPPAASKLFSKDDLGDVIDKLQNIVDKIATVGQDV